MKQSKTQTFNIPFYRTEIQTLFKFVKLLDIKRNFYSIKHTWKRDNTPVYTIQLNKTLNYFISSFRFLNYLDKTPMYTKQLEPCSARSTWTAGPGRTRTAAGSGRSAGCPPPCWTRSPGTCSRTPAPPPAAAGPTAGCSTGTSSCENTYIVICLN